MEKEPIYIEIDEEQPDGLVFENHLVKVVRYEKNAEVGIKKNGATHWLLLNQAVHCHTLSELGCTYMRVSDEELQFLFKDKDAEPSLNLIFRPDTTRRLKAISWKD